MTVWDFNENKNYIQIGNYKVLDLQDAEKAAKLLNDIDLMILRCFISIQFKENTRPK